MVCNSTQSALYKAVDTHNDSFSECGIGRKKTHEKKVQNTYQKNNKNVAFCGGNTYCENCQKRHINNSSYDPISRIMSDRDMLLIAGLIFILVRENADKTLILALAIVLLG